MKTIKLYKKYKRLDDGGIPPNEKFAQSVGYGNSALQVANTGNQMFGEQGNEFGVKSNSGAILGGGLQGAAMGAGVGSMFGTIGTIAGGVIGGTIGIIKSNQSNNEAKRREEDYKNQQKQLFLQNQQNSFNQVLNNGFQVQGNMNAQKYAKNGGLLYKKMGDGGKLKPAKIYTDKAEFLKAKEAYGDSLDLYNLSEKQRQLTSGTNNIKFDSKLFRNDYYKQENEEFKTRKETGDFVKRKVDIDLENTNKNPRIYISNRASGDIYHKDIKPTSMYYEKIDEEGKKYSDKSLWEDFKDVALGKNVSNLGAVNVSYKKPNQPVEFKETVLNKPATNSVSKSKTQVTQKATINPVVERMSEMTPVETIEPQVEDTLIKKDINMKPIYTSKSRVWNTFTPPTKKVERAPGLGGFNTIMKNGGNVKQLSKTNVQFNGNSHENGGIKEPLVNGVRLDEVEVEGNESMSTSNGQKFVFSDSLGFAQQHKPLAKAMGKIEKYLKSNPNDPIRKRTLNSLKEREEQLKVKQEETKEALGLENNLGEMKLGGAIKRKDGTYIDREGVMKYPLKNGGMVNYGDGGKLSKEDFVKKHAFELEPFDKDPKNFNRKDVKGYDHWFYDELPKHGYNEEEKRWIMSNLGNPLIKEKSKYSPQERTEEDAYIPNKEYLNPYNRNGILDYKSINPKTLNSKMPFGANQTSEEEQSVYKKGGLLKYAPGGPLPGLGGEYVSKRYESTTGAYPADPTFSVDGSVDNFLENYDTQRIMKQNGANIKLDGRYGPKSTLAFQQGYGRGRVNPGTGVLATQTDLNSRQSMNPNNYKNLPSASFLGGSSVTPSASVKDSSVGGPNSLEGLPGKGATTTTASGNKINWGNVAGKIIPYAGVAANYMLNEKARKMTTPKEALPDYVKYKPVDYSASKIEADQQRRQLNKSLTQNVTNSAVSAALKAKNLGTTIGAKNLINQEETNVNTQGINQNNLVNNQIQQRRNQIDVENRDRDYNKEQRYLTQKGEIANNFSDIYQQQGRDSKLYDLEDRKIDVLAKQDAARDVWYRNFLEDQKKQKESHKNGGLIKKSGKLYSKMKK